MNKGVFKKFVITCVTMVVLAALSVVLLADYMGISYSVAPFQLTDLPESALSQKEERENAEASCLVLRDSSQENNDIFTGHVEEVLQQMRVGYDITDLAGESVPDFSAYSTCIVVFQHLDVMGQSIVDMCNWVEQNGGRVLIFCSSDASPAYRYLCPYIGVEEGGRAYSSVNGMYLSDDFMIGSEGFQFHWDEPMSTAINIRLNDGAKVYAWSDDESRLPLVWSNNVGSGRFVVMNIGLSEKTTRGFTCACYSLLEDTCVYPVINASSFFLDDFPSPVPMGDGQYIRQTYNRDISSFYSNVWWPDMLQFCDDYGVKYTGVVIETYEEEVDGSFPRQQELERFEHFGALLLNHGGEIGLHGYNHLPLCFNGFDFKGEVDYETWNRREDVITAVQELIDFTSMLFPENQPSVYVPPSNILSEEGRALLKEEFPQIKTISSVYLYVDGQIEYTQEFEVAEDGIVEFPRVISGALLDQYMYWAAINTLNMYYVNSHFIHPDDVLDEDRGAALGWEQLHENLGNYMDWLYTSAPNIRNLVASDSARAVQRYDALSVERTDDEDGIHLRLTGFWDEAYLMVRCNKGTPGQVAGGTIEHIAGDYYLLRATEAQVDISIEGETA